MRDMALSELALQACGEITQVLLTGRTKRRLIEMGITPGVRVTLTRRAPLGDPLEISLRGYELTLRAEDAQAIRVREDAV